MVKFKIQWKYNHQWDFNIQYSEIQYSGRAPIFKGNSRFNNKTLKFKFLGSTKIQYAEKIQIEREIQHSTEYSMFNDKSKLNSNSTAIFWAIQRLFNGSTMTYEERQTFIRVNMNMNNDEYEYE